MITTVDYIIAFVISALVSVAATAGVRWFAVKKNIVDVPGTSERKIHAKPTPLLGGLAVFAAFHIGIFAFFHDELTTGYLLTKHLISLLIGGGLIMFGGYIDDRYNISARYQIIWPLMAVLIVVAGGIGVDYIRNPFGDFIWLNTYSIHVFSFNGLPYKITLFADIFTVMWILGSAYTTKMLDGLDGLVSGIGAIAAFIFFFLSLSKDVGQPETALLSIILAGALIGFLFWNYHPAKIFLGEGGSLFVGFMIGTLAILSGAKVATALLLLGIPALDILWVVGRRLLVERKSPFSGDRKHLHFRMLDIGFSQTTTVHILYVVTLVFGITGLLLSGRQKFFALAGLVIFMLILAVFIVYQYRKLPKNIAKDGRGSQD